MSVSLFLVLNWVMTIAAFGALGADALRRRFNAR
jgi:hypothetical protein